MGNTSSSYLGTTNTGLGSVGRGGASSQTAGPLQVARDRLRRRQRGTALASQMDGPANTLTTQGAEGTEASEPLREYPVRRERLDEATSLSASQFGIMVRNAKRRYDFMTSVASRGIGGVGRRKQREAARGARFREYERGEF